MTGAIQKVKKPRGPGRPFKPGQSGNPAGKPKGVKNKFTVEIKSLVEEALTAAGKAAQAEDVSLQGLSPGAAYLAKQAQDNPAAFISLVRMLMPAKLDVDVTVMNREMIDLLSYRRDQVAKMRDITPEDDE
jgi:hypothetical protein